MARQILPIKNVSDTKMHLLETYALTCGLKIDKPYVYEHYTTVPCEKFISFNKKCYPYYLEVINLIKPELDKRGIRVLQLLANQENAEADLRVHEGLSFGQWAYLVKHSLLHFGEDEYLFDLAGFYDIPRVIMYSNTYPTTTKPYWGSAQKERILYSTGKNQKPSFSTDPSGSFVRFIKPEKVAQNIMDLLGIEWSPPYETIYAGLQYRAHHDIIEIVPDKTQPVELNGKVLGITVRMDYQKDEEFLANVLDKTKAAIVTNSPINANLLQMLRTKIAEIAYLVDSNSDVNFVKELSKLNLPYGLLTYQQDKEIKEKFFEVSAVNTILTPKIEDIPELKGNLEGLSYKSSKRVIHGNLEYKGKYELDNKLPSKPNEFSPCPKEANVDFFREIEFFFIVKLKSKE